MLRPKNWDTFQHYKNRRPPWIRLYHSLLDEPDFWDMSGDDFKHLTALWLIASESENGELPDMKKIAFRLRISLADLDELLARLNGWIVADASKKRKPASKIAKVASKSDHAQEKLLHQRRDRGETETEERENAQSAAPLEPLSLNSDPMAEVPEGLTDFNYADAIMEAMCWPKRSMYSVHVALVDALPILARDEGCSLGEACRRMYGRIREAEASTKGIKWRFWIGEEQGWKLGELQALSTEGME